MRLQIQGGSCLRRQPGDLARVGLRALRLLPILRLDPVGVAAAQRLALAAAFELLLPLARSSAASECSAGAPAPSARAWSNLLDGGNWVTRHAVYAGFAATALLAVLALPALSLTSGPPDVSQLPAASKARIAFEEVSRVMGPGWATPYNVIVVARGKPITSPNLLASLDRFQTKIAGVPTVESGDGPRGHQHDLHTAVEVLARNSEVGQDLETEQEGSAQAHQRPRPSGIGLGPAPSRVGGRVVRRRGAPHRVRASAIRRDPASRRAGPGQVRVRTAGGRPGQGTHRRHGAQERRRPGAGRLDTASPGNRSGAHRRGSKPRGPEGTLVADLGHELDCVGR